MNNDGKKGFSEMSTEARLMMQRLREASLDDVVEYRELSTLIGRDVQVRARGQLSTARNRLLRDEGIYFDVIPGVGLKRVGDDGKIEAAKEKRVRVKNMARRTERLLSTVDISKLSNSALIDYNVERSLAGVLAHMTQERKVVALKDKFTASHVLPDAKMLEALREIL